MHPIKLSLVSGKILTILLYTDANNSFDINFNSQILFISEFCTPCFNSETPFTRLHIKIFGVSLDFVESKNLMFFEEYNTEFIIPLILSKSPGVSVITFDKILLVSCSTFADIVFEIFKFKLLPVNFITEPPSNGIIPLVSVGNNNE